MESKMGDQLGEIIDVGVDDGVEWPPDYNGRQPEILVGNNIYQQSPIKLGDMMDAQEIERQAMMMYGDDVVVGEVEEALLLEPVDSNDPALAPYGLQPIEMIVEEMP